MVLMMVNGENASEKTSIQWTVIKVGNLLYEQHERATPLVTNKMFGDPTITVIKGEKTVLVDPGYGPSRELNYGISETNLQANILVGYLALLGLKPSDIDIVFITHRHLDHFNLVDLFEHAGARVTIGGRGGGALMNGVEILHTPGHDPGHGSLKFTSRSSFGRKRKEMDWRVVVAGDAIVNLDYYKEFAPYWMNRYSHDEIELTRQSIRTIAKEADVIVPGHGQPFINIPELRCKWPGSIENSEQRTANSE